MDKQDLTKLLRLQSAELTESTPFCPEDQVIAEYFDCDLARSESEKLDRHLTDCRYCLARIGILERLEENRSDKRIPEAVLASAKQLRHDAPAHRPSMAPAWATAAVVVIALFAVIKSTEGPGPAPATGEDSRQLRNIERTASDLVVLTPQAGADISPGSPIEWAEVPGNLHYDIFVLSNSGDVLWTERLKDPGWVLDESLSLETGSQYYFRVEALMPDGRSLRSKHVVFQVGERQ